MAFDWYESDDATPAGTSYTLTTTAGTASAALELHAWLNKGSSVGDPETRYLRLYVEDGGVWKTSGLDTLDRREFEIRIVGSQNPDVVAEFVCPTTAWMPVGTRRTFQFPTIYPNCCIEIEVRVNPGLEGGQSSPVTFSIEAVTGTGEIPVSIPTDVSVDGTLDMGGERLTGLPLASVYDVTDAASVRWVMARPGKGFCQAAATSDVTLTGEQTVDAVALVEGDRVLLTNQATATENGKWVVSTGAWTRHPDCDDTMNMYPGARLWVAGGTANGRALWVQTAVISDYAADAQVWEKLAAL